MKRHVWIVGAFLLVVLLVAVEMAIISNASGYESKVKVVFAAERVSKNTIITSDMLELREISAEAVHPGALKSIDVALSKRAVMDIEPGEMLLNAKLSVNNDGIIEAVGKNNRLFSLELDADQANGWQLTENQYVDIIYVPNNSVVRYQSVIPEGKKEIREGQSIGGTETADDKTKADSAEVAADDNSKMRGADAAADSKSKISGVEAVNDKSKTDGAETVADDKTKIDNADAAAEAKNDATSMEPAYAVPVEVSGQVSVMKNIRIAGIIDEDGKLVDVSKVKSLPRYISFEVTQEQAAFLAYAKRNGKLELACIPDN